jgi:hypothetical protein
VYAQRVPAAEIRPTAVETLAAGQRVLAAAVASEG